MKYCSCKGYTSSKTKLEFHNFETVEVAPLKVVPMQSTLSTTVEFNDRVVEEPVIIVPKVVKKVEPVRAAPVRKPSPPKVFAKKDSENILPLTKKTQNTIIRERQKIRRQT